VRAAVPVALLTLDETEGPVLVSLYWQHLSYGEQLWTPSKHTFQYVSAWVCIYDTRSASISQSPSFPLLLLT
jgi:hypothetical protein